MTDKDLSQSYRDLNHAINTAIRQYDVDKLEYLIQLRTEDIVKRFLERAEKEE